MLPSSFAWDVQLSVIVAKTSSAVLQICIISEKEDTPEVLYTHIFENFFMEISIPFDFHSGVSG